jgi:hypothetical protein
MILEDANLQFGILRQANQNMVKPLISTLRCNFFSYYVADVHTLARGPLLVQTQGACRSVMLNSLVMTPFRAV